MAKIDGPVGLDVSTRNVIRSQFKETSFPDKKSSDRKEDEDSSSNQNCKASPLTNLILPQDILNKIKSQDQSIEGQIKKLRGMILAVSTYASLPLSNDESKTKLLDLYYPSIESKDQEAIKAID